MVSKTIDQTNKKSPKQRVAVGMSGGVDSSLVAALLTEQGYEVTGVFLECWRAPGCRVDEDREDALDVAISLNIPFKVLDFKTEYKQKVVDYFYAEYKAGRTPNPDVMCNREIKFGMFYAWAMKQGFDHVATGHYARIEESKDQKSKAENAYQNAEFALLQGVDDKKDQSYFLYQLKQEQLGHILFPLGDMTKTKVREEARKRKLKVADKPDLQGICFIGEVSTKSFLQSLGMKPQVGDVVMRHEGEVLVVGRHEGAWFYTIGQRHGFEVEKARVKQLEDRLGLDSEEMPGLYVVEKDVSTNQLVVGVREQLMKDALKIGKIHWISPDDGSRMTDERELKVRIRHGGELVRARLQVSGDTYQMMLEKPVFGVAPGQAVVMYQNEVCLGGGIIE